MSQPESTLISNPKTKIFYLCDRKSHCELPCYELCKHTSKIEYAKNYKERPFLIDLLNHNKFELLDADHEGIQFWEIERS